MKPDDFRRLALALPEAIESAHMGTPDFRVRGKIFATLGSGAQSRCVVKFTLEQQDMFMHVDPAAFEPVKGGWGRKGWTQILLANAQSPIVGDALTLAWRNVAPKKLAATLPVSTD
ncbi:MAG: MmcQ/YjbR family DNA-binding protein [Dokdonella sp.]